MKKLFLTVISCIFILEFAYTQKPIAESLYNIKSIDSNSIEMLLKTFQEGKEIGRTEVGKYKYIFYPGVISAIGIRISFDNGELMFYEIYDNLKDKYQISYIVQSKSKYILKNGVILYNTKEGLFGFSVFPDGSIDKAFCLANIK